MEHIKNIEIKNFKSIRHQKIEGCKRINVFVGPPNVGKTNVLEALGGFSCLLTSNEINIKDLIRFKETSDLFYIGNTEMVAEVSLDSKFYLNYKFNALNSFDIVIANESLEYLDTLRYLDVDQFYNSKYTDSVHQSTSRKTKLTEFEFWDAIDEVSKILKYDYKSNSNYIVSNNKSLVVPFGNNVQDIVEINQKLRSEIVALFAIYQQRLLFDRSRKDLRVLRFLDDETIFSLSIDLVADTLKRLIFYKAAILSNKNSVLLFEEPEAHCYEPYIMEITNAIKDDTNNNQFFIVTHSQYVIDELLRDKESRKDTNIYLVGLENSETVIKLLDEETSKDVYEQGLNVFFNFSSLWEETEKV